MYLINLAARPDRLVTVSARLDQFGFETELVVAHTHETATAHGTRVTGDLRGRLSMTPGDLGCIASHLKIYRMIIDRGQSGALILEDDLLPVTDFGERMREAFGRAQTTEVLQCGWLGYEHRLRNKVMDYRAQIMHRSRRDRWVPDTFAYGTHCYWVSATFAKFALGYMNPAFGPIDIMVAAAIRDSGLPLLRHWPPLAIQDDSPSDIADRIHGAKDGPRW